MSKEAKRNFLNNGKLIVEKNNIEIFALENPQNLYLYPLSIIDYIDNLTFNKPIFLNIIKIKDMNYYSLFHHTNFSNLRSVEIQVNNDYDIIKRIVSICNERNIRISLFISNLELVDENFLNEVIDKIDFLKIFFNYNDYDMFLHKISLINKIKKEDLLILVKSYLNLNQINNYEKYIFDLINKVDVYQLSKELLPLNKNNIKIDNKYSKIIRKLESKYNSKESGIIFLSVKDLTTLYYPRFELDERNNRRCFACKLKPYLYEDIVLPCKINEILNNMDKYGFKYNFSFDKFNGLGKTCSDCASIFENDLLGKISKLDFDKYYLK